MKIHVRARIQKATVTNDMSEGLQLLQQAISDVSESQTNLKNKKLLELLEKANAYFVSAQNTYEKEFGL